MPSAPTPPILLVRDPARGRETLAEYRDRGGYRALGHALARLEPDELCQLVLDADLRGRGGAGFPTGRKWQLARAAAASGPRYLVANGGEHEPGSSKDRRLVATYPHTVIEGVALAAWATGAGRAWLYLIADMTEAIASAEAAIAEATAAGLLGRGILGTPFSLDLAIRLAPASYVAGEETAALEVIEGREPLPRQKPPYPGEHGLFGAPTTVNNVETLAHVPAIVRHGADWFRELGVLGSAGTMLFTLGPELGRPGVHEVPFGTTFRELIEGHGGGLRSGGPVRAIHPARSSAFLGASALDLTIDHATVRAAGSSLGCGGLTVIGDGECMVEHALAVARFFAAAQCGQCPPCRMETATIAAVLAKVQAGESDAYRAQIEKVAAFTARKGRCSLIEMAAAPVLSALELFPDDFRHHAEHGRCRR